MALKLDEVIDHGKLLFFVCNFIERDRTNCMDKKFDCVINCKLEKSMYLSQYTRTCTDPLCYSTSVNFKVEITLIIYFKWKEWLTGAQFKWCGWGEARLCAKQKKSIKSCEGNKL
jgi:hypothetical protein